MAAAKQSGTSEKDLRQCELNQSHFTASVDVLYSNSKDGTPCSLRGKALVGLLIVRRSVLQERLHHLWSAFQQCPEGGAIAVIIVNLQASHSKYKPCSRASTSCTYHQLAMFDRQD